LFFALIPKNAQSKCIGNFQKTEKSRNLKIP
jgi:hypothetical protein